MSYDLDVKASRYAIAGVPACWIVDLNADEILVLRGPSPDGYVDNRRARRGDKIEASGLPGTTKTVDELLGPLVD